MKMGTSRWSQNKAWIDYSVVSKVRCLKPINSIDEWVPSIWLPGYFINCIIFEKFLPDLNFHTDFNNIPAIISANKMSQMIFFWISNHRIGLSNRATIYFTFAQEMLDPVFILRSVGQVLPQIAKWSYPCIDLYVRIYWIVYLHLLLQSIDRHSEVRNIWSLDPMQLLHIFAAHLIWFCNRHP